MAATIRARSGFATRLSSSAALSLIRIEKLTPDLVPIQHRIARIAEPVDGNGEIVEVFEIVLDGEADDIGPAASELLRSRVQRIDQRVGQSGLEAGRAGRRNLADPASTSGDLTQRSAEPRAPRAYGQIRVRT